MTFHLSQRFYFEAAHTLQRAVHDGAERDASRRVHGHTYQAEVTVSGQPDAGSGMVVDLAVLRAAVAAVRDTLDHRLLDDVPGLARPTLEQLCAYIATALTASQLPVSAVRVWREASGDACTLTLDGRDRARTDLDQR